MSAGQGSSSRKTRSQSIDRSDNANAALVQEVIKDIIKNKTFLSLVEGSISKRLNEMEQTIEKQDALIMELQTSNNDKSKELTALKQQVNRLNYNLEALDQKLDAQEQYSRRNCVRLFGCPEKSGENTYITVLKVASEHLHMDLKLEDIERSHRVGKRKEHPDRQNPRGIIVKFKSYRKRQEFISKRRQLKGQKISIVEDLTSRNQKLLNETRTNIKVDKAWSKDGRIYALLKGNNNQTKLIHNSEDLKKL